MDDREDQSQDQTGQASQGLDSHLMDFIYDDILTERDDSARHEIIQEEEARERNHREQLGILEAEREQLQKKLALAEENLQTLLKTARAEVARKDARIAELKRQVDDLAFRRAIRTGHREEFEKVFEVAHGRDRQEREDLLAGKLIREYLSGRRGKKRQRQQEKQENVDDKGENPQSEPAAKVRRCEAASRPTASTSSFNGNDSAKNKVEPVNGHSLKDATPKRKVVENADGLNKDKVEPRGEKSKLDNRGEERIKESERKDRSAKEKPEETLPSSEGKSKVKSDRAKEGKSDKSDKSGLMKSLFGSDSPEKVPQPARLSQLQNSEAKKDSTSRRGDRPEERERTLDRVAKANSKPSGRERGNRRQESEADRSSKYDRPERRGGTPNKPSSRSSERDSERPGSRRGKEDELRGSDRSEGKRGTPDRGKYASPRSTDRRKEERRRADKDGLRRSERREDDIKERDKRQALGSRSRNRDSGREAETEKRSGRRNADSFKESGLEREQQVGSREKTREDKSKRDENTKNSRDKRTDSDKLDTNPRNVEESVSEKSELPKQPFKDSRLSDSEEREDGEISEGENEKNEEVKKETKEKEKCEKKTSYRIPKKRELDVKAKANMGQSTADVEDKSKSGISLANNTVQESEKVSEAEQLGVLTAPVGKKAMRESSEIAAKSQEEMDKEMTENAVKSIINDSASVTEATSKCESKSPDPKRRPNLSAQSTTLSTPKKSCKRKWSETDSPSPAKNSNHLAGVEDMDSTELEDLLERKRRELNGLIVEKEECIQKLSNPGADSESFVRRISPRKHQGTKPLDEDAAKKRTPRLKIKLKRTPPSAEMECAEYQPECPTPAVEPSSAEQDALPNPPDLSSPEAIASMLKGKLAHGAHVSPVSGIIKTPTTSNPSSRRYPLRRSSRQSSVTEGSASPSPTKARWEPSAAGAMGTGSGDLKLRVKSRSKELFKESHDHDESAMAEAPLPMQSQEEEVDMRHQQQLEPSFSSAENASILAQDLTMTDDDSTMDMSGGSNREASGGGNDTTGDTLHTPPNQISSEAQDYQGEVTNEKGTTKEEIVSRSFAGEDTGVPVSQPDSDPTMMDNMSGEDANHFADVLVDKTEEESETHVSAHSAADTFLAPGIMSNPPPVAAASMEAGPSTSDKENRGNNGELDETPPGRYPVASTPRVPLNPANESRTTGDQDESSSSSSASSSASDSPKSKKKSSKKKKKKDKKKKAKKEKKKKKKKRKHKKRTFDDSRHSQENHTFISMVSND